MKCLKKHSFLFAALLLAVCLLFYACAPAYGSVYGYGMGTYLSVSAKDEDFSLSLLPMANALEAEISHRIPTSLVASLNRGEETLLSDALLFALSLCLEIEEKTSGAFTPFALPITSLWQFDGESTAIPDASALAEAVNAVKNTSLSLSGSRALLTGGGIDLGAVGKGMAADAMADAVKEKGEDALISVGGSIAAVGKKNGENWRVGVRNPFSASQNSVIGTLSLSDAFVSTSGSYEKCFSFDGKTYHHILDPKTGMPIENGIVSVTVIAQSGVLSDILSTAVFAVGIEAGAALCEEYGAEVLLVKADGGMYASDGFLAVFSPSSDTEVLPL